MSHWLVAIFADMGREQGLRVEELEDGSITLRAKPEKNEGGESQ